ncbi:hypothetical protein L210DRAFT_3508360 [Boletus edulis BED1]|uniref:Uncharacterized protein n=1 Tax=Boletus edulis BED1 TaxID=1328754 RepID=A0AAD4BHA5_BOLED|nr:hypothetical protein L210DRAFT_3508360 [Boletus edulis BED1]
MSTCSNVLEQYQDTQHLARQIEVCHQRTPLFRPQFGTTLSHPPSALTINRSYVQAPHHNRRRQTIDPCLSPKIATGGFVPADAATRRLTHTIYISIPARLLRMSHRIQGFYLKHVPRLGSVPSCTGSSSAFFPLLSRTASSIVHIYIRIRIHAA